MHKALKRYSPIFVLPTLLAFIIGFIVPFAQGLYLSFCKFTTVDNAKWVGFANYNVILKDASFLNSFKFTILFAVFYAEPDRWYRTWLYLADPHQLYFVTCKQTASGTEFISRLLGTYHSDVLAADRIYDDHLHCRSAECTVRSCGSS